MSKPCRTYYLQLLAPKPELRLPLPQGDLVEVNDPQINRDMYLKVGASWGWTDKAAWPLERWQTYVAGFGEDVSLEQAPIEKMVTVLLKVSDQAAGYFELGQVGEDVEIRYFGLLPQTIGKGLGGPLLSAAIERGWQMGAKRLWVHTCDLDHPAALVNYQRRGFELYKTQLE